MSTLHGPLHRRSIHVELFYLQCFHRTLRTSIHIHSAIVVKSLLLNQVIFGLYYFMMFCEYGNNGFMVNIIFINTKYN